jgi:NAD-dependent SIR2 family protein deacetylase
MARMRRDAERDHAALQAFVRASRRLLVLTGAGCSTESGIPDYRDESGAWKRSPPMQLREFLADDCARQRYWTRSLLGWPVIAHAQPNPAHAALARLEARGGFCELITQNVDGLHQRAGSRAVIDLHGRLDEVECLGCGAVQPRAELQRQLEALNPGLRLQPAMRAPDGDADIDALLCADFRVPGCSACGGVLKPRVVFFGESVPRPRVERAIAALEAADALLVAGSSLMVWSGFRFVRRAHERGLPIAIVNLGRTRAEALASLRVHARCGDALAAVADALCSAA